MLIYHKGHTDTIQVHSVTVMTHVKALQAGHSSQGTSEPITPGLRPHTVLACRSHRVLTIYISPPLKYVMLLWNMYCCSEIYIAALKYVLPLWNMYCCTKPSLYSKIWAPPHERVHHYTVKYGHRPTNGSITASYRVLTVCHRLYPPGEKFLAWPKLSPGLAGR